MASAIQEPIDNQFPRHFWLIWHGLSRLAYSCPIAEKSTIQNIGGVAMQPDRSKPSTACGPCRKRRAKVAVTHALLEKSI
jgi:hypothetical protein